MPYRGTLELGSFAALVVHAALIFAHTDNVLR